MPLAPADIERLHAWLDGDLSPADEQVLLGALTRDPELRAAAHALREARDLVRRIAPATAPEGFAERVLQAADREPVSLDRWRALRRPFGVPIEAVALAAAVILVVAVGLRSGGEPPAAPTVDGFEETTVPTASPAALPQAKPAAGDAKLETASRPAAKLVPSTAPTKATEAAPPADAILAIGGTASAPPEASPMTSTPVAEGYAGWSYTVTSADPDVSSTIQSIAAKHGARAKVVTDESGQETWFLDLDLKRVRAFEADLEKLGIVSSASDPKMQLGETVPVQVKIAPGTQKAKPTKQAAPRPSTEK